MQNKQYPFLKDGEEKFFTKDILDQAVLMTLQKKKMPLKSDIPFKMFLSTLADTKVIVGVEWANRWSNGRPKKPNGHPLRRRSADERERIDAAITMGVIEDYNDEAMERGQGIDFGEDDE